MKQRRTNRKGKRLSDTFLNMQRCQDLARQRKRMLVSNATEAEIQFRTILERLKIPHLFQRIIFTEKKFFLPDFVLKAARLIVEIDGPDHLRKTGRDAWRIELILNTATYRDYQVIRFQNDQVLSGEAEKVIGEVYAREELKWSIVDAMLERKIEKRRRQIARKRGPKLARWFASLPAE